jgi:prophage DNA circulation protein
MQALAREEATRVVATVIADLVATVTIDPGRPGALFRLAVGDLLADAEELIETAAIAEPIANVFNLARAAGATVEQLEAIRRRTIPIVVLAFPAWSVGNTCIRCLLVQMARILAAMTFTSRSQIDGYIDGINRAFDNAETVAANARDQASYRSLVALHAAVTYDLTTRARTLPTIVLYDFAVPRPAIWICNRLYGGDERTQELIDENHPVHPAFVQQPTRALSQ